MRARPLPLPRWSAIGSAARRNTGWFHPEDGALGSEDVVILSYGLWQRRFGAEATVIGEPLRLDFPCGLPPYCREALAATVVGVMPAGFHYFEPDTQLWVPTRLTATGVPLYSSGPGDDQTRMDAHLIARLVAGVTLARAQVTMETLSATNFYLTNSLERSYLNRLMASTTFIPTFLIEVSD